MKQILFLISIIFFWSACSTAQKSNQSTSLEPKEFQARIDALPNAPILDVRTSGEFDGGHIKNAVNYNWNGNNFEQQISGLDKNKPVLVYCLSGGRSGSAAAKMRQQGFKEVYELNGGMIKWRSEGLPEIKKMQAGTSGMNRSDFDLLATSADRVLIDFYADWCAPCKKMKPYLDEMERTMPDKVKIVRIDADKNPALLKNLKIEGLPYLMLFEKNKLVWQHMGFASKEDVLKQMGI